MTENGTFRPKNGFTIVQNTLAKDSSIPLNAKGLYLLISANITTPNKVWHKDDFLNRAIEGSKAFDTAWNELKKAGYLHVHMYSTGTTWKVEYELLDEPQPGPHTFYYNAKGVLTKTNLDRNPSVNCKKNQETQTPKTKSDRIPHLGCNGHGINASGTIENGSNSNNTDIDLKQKNNKSISNPISKDRLDVDRDAKIQLIKKNIEYDILRADHPSAAILEEIVQLIIETVTSSQDYLFIAKNKRPVEIVKSKFLKLNRFHIEYVLECFNRTTTTITNIRQYLLAALYNAPDTMNSYYRASINHQSQYTSNQH